MNCGKCKGENRFASWRPGVCMACGVEHSAETEVCSLCGGKVMPTTATAAIAPPGVRAR
jgi:rRNA maturation endonuclease Nob1